MNSACGLVITAPLHSEGLRFEYSASVCFFALFFSFLFFFPFFFPFKEYVGNVQIKSAILKTVGGLG